MRLETSRALEMAVKAAAQKSPMDTSRAIEGFYFHRLLCRIFSSPENQFVLKGGHSILARTINARATRDIDLMYKTQDLDSALEALKTLASIDLNDHVRFVFNDAKRIKINDEYRDGLHVSFIPWLGSKRLRPICVDLVVDAIPIENVETITPVDRINIEGIPTFDYLIYPPEYALTDKLCAIIERHDGRPSSRVKDLIDILIYTRTCTVNGNKLIAKVEQETSMRSIRLPNEFYVPEEWEKSYARHFSKLHTQAKLPESSATIADAVLMAGLLYNPVFSHEAKNCIWTPEEYKWIHI